MYALLFSMCSVCIVLVCAVLFRDSAASVFSKRYAVHLVV